MFDTLDILVEYFEPTDGWFVTPQTLNKIEDPDEDPNQESYTGAQFYDGEAETHAIEFARNLGEKAVKAGETRQAVVYHKGIEAYYIDKDGTIERTV